MAKHRIYYREGYEYQLAADYSIVVGIIPPRNIKTQFIELYVTGLLIIRSGYAWDGPSGPVLDTPSAMRGSLVHDALSQLMREGLLSEENKRLADEEYKRLCLEDGMWRLRAWAHFAVLSRFDFYVKREYDRKVLCAPDSGE